MRDEHDMIIEGNSAEVLRDFDENSIDAVTAHAERTVANDDSLAADCTTEAPAQPALIDTDEEAAE